MDKLEEFLKSQGVETSNLTLDAPDMSTPGGGYIKDADTVTTADGTTIRLRGVNAREVQGTNDETGMPKGETMGAELQQKFTKELIDKNNLSVPILYGPKDKYKRALGDLTNPEGSETLTGLQIKAGIVDPLLQTPEQETQTNMARLERANRKYQGVRTRADEMLEALNVERNTIGLAGKKYATSAKQYGGSLDKQNNSDYYTGAGYIGADEDEKGFARNNWTTGWASGVTKMKQDMFGSLDLLATTQNIDSLKGVATRNIRSLQSEIEDLPYIRNGEAMEAPIVASI